MSVKTTKKKVVNTTRKVERKHRLKSAIAVGASILGTGAAVTTPHAGSSLATFDGCPMKGNATKSNELASNQLKNRFVLPTDGDFSLQSGTETEDRAVQNFIAVRDGDPPSSTNPLDQAKAVTIEGYIVEVKPGSPESCNCGEAKDLAKMDTHIYMLADLSGYNASGAKPKDRYNKEDAVIVEVTPRIRSLMASRADWSTDALMKRYNEAKPPIKVQVSGWLFYDAQHVPNSVLPNHPTSGNIFRHNCWEVHPVTSIEDVEGQ